MTALRPVDAFEHLGRLVEEIALFGELLERLGGRLVIGRALERHPQRAEAARRLLELANLEHAEPMVELGLRRFRRLHGHDATLEHLGERLVSPKPRVEPIERLEQLGLVAGLLDGLGVGLDRARVVAASCSSATCRAATQRSLREVRVEGGLRRAR